MGPAARHLALDDSWSGWNWKKILGMGATLFSCLCLAQLLIILLGDLLLRSLLKALLMKAKHASENKKFDDTLPLNVREGWLKMIRDWESDKSNPNPYAYTEKGLSVSRSNDSCILMST